MLDLSNTSGGQPHEGQTRERRYLLPRDITQDANFQFRHTGLDKGHVRGLLQTLRATGGLDPILVWAETEDTEGTPTGRLVLLDGHHRLSAYATAGGKRKGLPAIVLKGSREEAMLEAVRANSRESLPLTKNERMDAAWRLVRLPGKRLTVPAIAGASGVAPRSVDNMRKRWVLMLAEAKEPTGHWWRDRQDAPPEMKDRPEMTDKEREATISQLATVLREALDKMPWRDESIAAEALERAFGTRKLRTMAEYLFSGETFGENENEAFGETIKEPEIATENQDF